MKHGIMVFLIVAVTATVSAAGEPRLSDRPAGPPTRGPVATYVTDANEIVQALVGTQVQIANATLLAAGTAAGTFVGGSGVIGFDSGVILGTGDITYVTGPNSSDYIGADNALAGDAALDGLIPGFETFDATVLEFDFFCQTLSSFTFQYVFASDEYNEYVDSEYNDVFGFFLDGQSPGDNIAIVPGFCSNPGLTVAINNVNCGNPYAGAGPNCDCYRNNDLDDGGGAIDTEMDGLTEVFFTTGSVTPGVWHHIKLAIADAGDHVYDSNVFIKGESFNCGGTPQVGACCDDGDCHQLTFEECVAAQYDPGWIGAGVACDPNPCNLAPECDAGGPYSGDAGVPIHFDASASHDPNGSIVLYEWDFGDGTTGTGVAPTHIYAVDGEYNVTLCVTDNDGMMSCCDTDGGDVVPTLKTTWGSVKTLYR
jgi:hypothetical protein